MKRDIALTLTLALVCAGSAGPVVAQTLTPNEEVGKSIFFDKKLSINNNQSCADCHAPIVGWTGPKPGFNMAGAVYEGSINNRFGGRKPPAAGYATLSPIFGPVVEGAETLFVGGNFWDGRATGEKLGNPAADQAQGPFLNPVEQALPDSACVVYRVCTSNLYGDLFQELYEGSCDIRWPSDSEMKTVCADEAGVVALSAEDRATSDTAYDNIALAIAAYEDSPEVNQFSSKYDAYLAGQAQLTGQELGGLELFTGKALCANCHTLDPVGPNGEPLLTDFTFDNLGVPKNPENPWYTMPPEFNPDGFAWVDPGLGGFLATRPEYEELAAENLGKHKVPSLRNVDKRPGGGFAKAFTHNGYFKSLDSLVHFYNTRDVKPVCPDEFTTEADALAQNCWPVPEEPANVNADELGDLGLSRAEEDALVAFLKTLSDGF
jgi:cytochrome c peroxidase